MTTSRKPALPLYKSTPVDRLMAACGLLVLTHAFPSGFPFPELVHRWTLLVFAVGLFLTVESRALRSLCGVLAFTLTVAAVSRSGDALSYIPSTAFIPPARFENAPMREVLQYIAKPSRHSAGCSFTVRGTDPIDQPVTVEFSAGCTMAEAVRRTAEAGGYGFDARGGSLGCGNAPSPGRPGFRLSKAALGNMRSFEDNTVMIYPDYCWYSSTDSTNAPGSKQDHPYHGLD